MMPLIEGLAPEQVESCTRAAVADVLHNHIEEFELAKLRFIRLMLEARKRELEEILGRAGCERPPMPTTP